LELAITVTIMAVALGAIVSTLTASIFLSSANRESHQAMLAARSAVERVRGETFANAFATFNADPADDPGGPGTAPGNAFDVPGLSPQAADPDGRVGEILFPGDGFQLREDVVDAGLGLPRDLSADGEIDAADHAGDYVLLPVQVRLRWRGESGNREVEYVTYLMEMQ
jgi:type II secretory pathway pseudopilin PulG